MSTMDIDNTVRQDDNPPVPVQEQPQRKKCRGNRRNQRFRRKCRAQKIKPAKIEKLLKKLNRQNKKNQRNNNRKNTNNDPRPTTVSNRGLTDSNMPMVAAATAATTTMATTTTTTTTIRKLNKRKRDTSLQNLTTHSITVPKSTSSIAIVAQPSLKKMKGKQVTQTMIDTTLHMNYRRPMYLERSSTILFQLLNRTFNATFKRKDEKEFIYTRLDLFDQHYCLEVHQQLWQSYFDIGREKHLWPDQLQRMAKTDDFDLCQQYLINYMETIKTQLTKYQIELNKQKESCSITDLSMDQIDRGLKQFIDCQRKYLSMRNNTELMKFKDHISEKDLFHSISTCQLTTDQNESLQRLMTIRQQEISILEELLMLEMRVLCKFLPLNFNQLETFTVSMSYSPLIKQQKVIQFNNKRYRIRQEGKRNWLHLFLTAYEIKLQEYDQQYQNEFRQFETANLSNNVTTTVDDLSILNKIKEYMVYHTNRLKQDIFKRMSSFRTKLLQNRQRSSTTKHTVGVSPEPYLDLYENIFNMLQWTQLSLGPSFIRLNQSALRPVKQQKLAIEKEHKEIFHKVQNRLVAKPHSVPIESPYFKQYSYHLLKYLNGYYCSPISYKDQIQALQQIRIAKTIREKIKKANLIIRVTDKGHNFYIGSAIEFEKKVQEFFHDTNAFIPLSENPLDQIRNNIIDFLNKLRREAVIFQEQYDAMIPDRTKSELAHLYFNPKTHKDGIPVRPIENTIYAPTTNISKFLDKIIRPIFNDACRETSIIDGTSFINSMLKYINKGLFKPSTLFCTFDIRNLFTMVPQEEALNILVEFLQAHGKPNVNGIPLTTIRELASIVLKENVFGYDNKLYQQVIGGAMGSSFTLTLANIFMWKWQKEFVRRQDITGEFYGRYIDDGFMTWNKSEKALIEFLNEANTWHSNIKLDYKIGKSLPFLDILLTNNNGILSTSVYHKPSAEPYVVPFMSDHPRHIFVNIIQSRLAHALSYSSTFEAFNYERRCIKLMLLYNGYPSSFIETQFRKFFIDYLPSTSLLPFITDENHFFLMRNKLLSKPTKRQSQVALGIAAVAAEDTNQTHAIQQNTTAESTTKKNKKDKKFENKIFIHYTHEKRLQTMKRGLHEVHKDILNESATKTLKMIVGHRNRRNATHELIRKRPRRSLLKNQPRQKKQTKAKKSATLNPTADQPQKI